jgi:hypothetical protein
MENKTICIDGKQVCLNELFKTSDALKAARKRLEQITMHTEED